MTTTHLHGDMDTTAHIAAAVLCPSLRVHRIDRTETSLLLSGVLDGRDVVAKHPVDRRPFWLARARHEITVYRTLPALGPVPVTTPRLVAADPDQHLLIITRVPGHPVHPHRYVTEPIPSRHLDPVLDLLNQVHRWRPPQPEALPRDDDYRHQLTSIRGSAITDAQLTAHSPYTPPLPANSSSNSNTATPPGERDPI